MARKRARRRQRPSVHHHRPQHRRQLRRRHPRLRLHRTPTPTPTPAPTPPPTVVPRDGHAQLSYDEATNRINSAGWEYDAAGNQTRVQTASSSWQRLEYDAAGRLVRVRDEAGSVLASYTYGATNERLISQEGDVRTYYAWSGSAVITEYTGDTIKGCGNTLRAVYPSSWQKSEGLKPEGGGTPPWGSVPKWRPVRHLPPGRRCGIG